MLFRLRDILEGLYDLLLNFLILFQMVDIGVKRFISERNFLQEFLFASIIILLAMALSLLKINRVLSDGWRFSCLRAFFLFLMAIAHF